MLCQENEKEEVNEETGYIRKLAQCLLLTGTVSQSVGIREYLPLTHFSPFPPLLEPSFLRITVLVRDVQFKKLLPSRKTVVHLHKVPSWKTRNQRKETNLTTDQRVVAVLRTAMCVWVCVFCCCSSRETPNSSAIPVFNPTAVDDLLGKSTSLVFFHVAVIKNAAIPPTLDSSCFPFSSYVIICKIDTTTCGFCFRTHTHVVVMIKCCNHITFVTRITRTQFS